MRPVTLSLHHQVEKVISGGQVGADIAGLRAAKALGLATGGWLPMGSRTALGPKPELLKEYDMQECERPGYAARTLRNVIDSDGTLRLAYNFKSRGELATLRSLLAARKPFYDVLIQMGAYRPLGPGSERVLYISPNEEEMVKGWLRATGIRTLNIAGNGTRRIESLVEDFLVEVLK